MAISSLALGWIKIAPFFLLGMLYSRARIDSKERMRRYFFTRPILYGITILLLAIPMVWFLYRITFAWDRSDDLGFPEFIPFIPILVLAALYDRWIYTQSMDLRLPRTIDNHCR